MTDRSPTHSSAPSPSLDWEVVGRYLAGESSPAEAEAVRRWLEEHPDDARLVNALDAAAKHATPSFEVDVEAALRTVKTRMHSRAPTSTSPGARTYAFASGPSWRRYTGIAVAAGVLLMVGVLLMKRAPIGGPPTPARSYATIVGERKEVLLGDGTQVILGPATRLVVTGRKAELVGEAFFSVAHDSLRPFVVHAGGAVIRDIGTEFTVHSDSGEAVRVVVSQGVVSLTYARDSVLLSRGDVGVLDQGRVQARPGTATDDDLAWTLGRLVFRDASVAELSADLRRWYGVEVRVTDSTLLQRHFTGSFARETPERVLDVIALALGARVDRRGDTAYIRIPPPVR